MDYIEILQKLEPLFKEAGQLAYRMQNGVNSHNKYNTGNPTADIVTDADFAVQEVILEAMLKTDLTDCRLLAEEDTELAKKFNPNGTYYLSIDPIDDTAIYAKGGEHFSTIIALHDGEKYLYYFVYFPAWDWGCKIVDGKFEMFGTAPAVLENLEKTIIYWGGTPQEHIPKEAYEDLMNQGVVFKKPEELGGQFGSIAPFVLGRIFGLYQQDMNTYDGMTEYNIAKAKGWEIISSDIDLRNIQKRESGLYYSGWYLALCK